MRPESKLRQAAVDPRESSDDLCGGEGATNATDALLTEILESVAAGICVWGADLRLVSWNSAYQDINGIPDHVLRPGAPLAEILNNSLPLFDDARTGDELEQLTRDLLAAKGRLELDRVLANGRIISVAYHAFSRGGWIAFYLDVTERRKDLRRLQKSQRALKLQNMRFETAVNNMPHGLCMFDSELKLVICNAAYADIYSLPPELALPGTSLRDIHEYRLQKSVHKDKEAYFQRRIEIVKQREKVSEVIELQDGRVISAAHIPMQDGGWVSTHQDITDEIRHLRALEEREAELQHQNMRFEAAVNNMWQGLCMFDGDKKLVICNADYARMYKLPPELVRPGTSIHEIFAARLAAGVVPANGSPETYINRRLAVVENPHDNIDEVELRDGRVLAVRHHPMADGGWVATHIDVTEQRRNEARIRHLARHDTLTDLPNRMLFLEHMELAQLRIRRRENMAVLCFDLDHFKAVNDTFGHSAGDVVLTEVGARLRQCCRQADVVARLGGDEFAALVGPLQKPEDATAVAENIIRLMAKPFEFQGQSIQIGASVGIAVAPNDGEDTDTLMKNADLALYRAKSEGRGAYHFFEPGMDAALQTRRAVELGLRNALAKGELELVYQPQLNLRENRVCGLEALLRWNRPSGSITPREFIPVAEETGLIVPIGEWVLREACATAASWPENVWVAVNLSSVQFKNRNLVQHVMSALANAGLGANRLELEITESVFLADSEATLKTLHQLRTLGVRISMDDFGTGYSSLSYLRSFPFDKIKIDRSFIQDLTSKEGSLPIVKAVIGLGKTLGMSTTAEGIETAEQLRIMRKEGCTEVQGFLFSPPLSSGAAARLFQNSEAHLKRRAS